LSLKMCDNRWRLTLFAPHGGDTVSAPDSPHGADRNLLFGILALQLDFVSQDALIRAMNGWVLDKTKTIGQILIEQGALAADRHMVLAALVHEYLKQHGNDARKCLAALSGVGSVRDQLGAVNDPEVEATLKYLARTDREQSGVDWAPQCVPTSLSAAAPEMLGRFVLWEIVGKGRFGQVYRAYDTVLERDVALKIPRAKPQEPEEIQHFLAEAKSSARLRHPNIVIVFDAGRVKDQYFIASEFVSGESLSTRIARQRPTFRQAATWVRDLALGLAYAHEMGVIHRDIKPGNIMINQDLRPQLTDFGLAKHRPVADGDQPLPPGQTGNVTVDGTLIGTPVYMSPEQARGDVKAVGPRSDIYSLGCVLYELMTGRPPFAGSVSEVVAAKATRRPPRPGTIRRNIPQGLENVCAKAMASHPENRYESAAHLAAGLQVWLEGEPFRVRPRPRPEQALRWCRKHRKTAFAIALVIVLGTGTVGYLARELFATTRKVEWMQCDADQTRTAQLVAQGRPCEALLWLARAWAQTIRLHDAAGEKKCANGLVKIAGDGWHDNSTSIESIFGSAAISL
jgi:hypothetical protein